MILLPPRPLKGELLPNSLKVEESEVPFRGFRGKCLVSKPVRIYSTRQLLSNYLAVD